MYHYEYRNNLYYLIDDRGEVITTHEKVALCFTYGQDDCYLQSKSHVGDFKKSPRGVLHKHGSPENVNKWAIKTRKKFMEASKDLELHKQLAARGVPTTSIDYEQMAKEIIVIEGKFPVEELQKCIDISGYVGKFYEKLQKEEYHAA